MAVLTFPVQMLVAADGSPHHYSMTVLTTGEVLMAIDGKRVKKAPRPQGSTS